MIAYGTDYPDPWVDEVSLLDPLYELWSARPVLNHIQRFARARRAGPVGTLGVVLARAVAAVEPTVVLPPTIGGRASLNVFVALVGPSGAGKGAVTAAASDAVTFNDFGGRSIDIEEFPPGSGEGLSRTFRPVGAADDAANQRTRALFEVGEVDSLGALGSRSGSTLMPELRKIYMGEPVGFQNGSAATRSVVPAHSYRASLIVGVQPLKAGTLLDDADGGTPQRFVWVSVFDPDAPSSVDGAPAQWTVNLPRWEADHVLEIPGVARREIDTHRLATLRGESVNPLDGHALLCRLKVAAALMILDGRTIVSDEDWGLAGIVMAESSRTRADVERAISEDRRAKNRARAEADGDRASIVDGKREDGEVERTRTRVLRSLDTDEWVSRGNLNRALKSDLRPHLNGVLQELADDGRISRRDSARTPEYRLAPQTWTSTSTLKNVA